MDSSDKDRMLECKDELQRFMFEEELKNCCLLVIANKQDLPNAMTVEDITEKLGLNALPKDRQWRKSN